MQPPRRRQGRLARPGCAIAYEVCGEGPAVVFAHGLGGNQMSWWQQVAHFAPTRTCVSFSHRGFAPSSPIAGGPDPRDFAADLAALADHLALASFTLVAQSMGGWTAVEYALAHPDRLDALVLAATTGTVDPARLREPERSRCAAWQAEAGARIAGLFARGIHPAAGERMAREQAALHLLYRQIDETSGELDKEALRTRLVAMRTRPPGDLAVLDCPLLLVSGDEDVVMPPFAADAIAAAVPQARVVHLPHAGHSAYFERADAFNRALASILDRA